MAKVYHITGMDRNGKRFKIVTDNPIHAMGINLWRGTVWEVTEGKRKVVKRVYNMLTKRQALNEFKQQWALAEQSDPRLKGDNPARCEAWNNYTDMLCKEGLITDSQYRNWTNPF